LDNKFTVRNQTFGCLELLVRCCSTKWYFNLPCHLFLFPQWDKIVEITQFSFWWKFKSVWDCCKTWTSCR
jgi:hypothetical protein